MANIEDDWAETKCFELISEFKRRPLLWDKKNRYFHNRNMRRIAWKEIGDAINTSADQCKAKMNYMMIKARQEQAKIVKSIKTLKSDRRIVTSRPYKSGWFAFREMAFLLHSDSKRKHQQNEDSDGIGENIENTKRPSTEPDILQPQTEAGPIQMPSERDEEIVSFTSFIENKMKTYSETTKNAVQQAIWDIIIKADQNHYESNFNEKSTITDAAPAPLKKEEEYESFEEYVEYKPIMKIEYSDSD